MKRYALFFLLLLLPFILSAEPVSLQRARLLANTFFETDGTRAGSPQLLCAYDENSHVIGNTRSEGKAALYVFNRPEGGFVIISGDDAFMPILGYSYTGQFREDESMPDNLRGWIEEMTGSIAEIRATHIKASTKEAAAWDCYESKTRGTIRRIEPVVLYTTADWAQGDPYNRFTPTVNGQQTVTGCVATSIGILMKYYEYPTRCKGPIPGISGEGYSVPTREVDYNYEWDKMQMTYAEGTTYSDDQINACARLLADIGQVGTLTYGVNSTGGVTKDVLGLMVDYFGYDKAMTNESRYYYSDEQWIEKLKGELDKRPLSYTGRSSTGGHAFVADGYDVSGMIHINWGWNGSSNGFFSINALGKYTASHAATFGFRPSVNGDYVPLYAIYVGTTSGGVSYNGIEMVSSGISPNKTFMVKVGGIVNKGYTTFSDAEIGVGHCDKAGNLKGMVNISKIDVSNLDPGYWRGFEAVPCCITKPISADDVLRVFFRASGSDWQPIRAETSAGAVAELRIADALSIDAASTMTYNKVAGEIVITTKINAQISVYNASSSSLADYVTISPGQVVIRVTQLPKGTYSVSMVTPTEAKVIKIVR